jgi:hypothetical protein
MVKKSRGDGGKGDRKETMLGEVQGAREVKAMEVLHAMFIKEMANAANLKAFEARQQSVGRAHLLAGAGEVLARCHGAGGEQDR